MLGSHFILFLTNLGEKSDQFMALKYREESGVPDILTLMNFNLDFDRDCRSYSKFKYFPIFWVVKIWMQTVSPQVLKYLNALSIYVYPKLRGKMEKYNNTNKTLATIIRKSVIYRIFN